MHRGFGNAEFLRRFPHSGIGGDHKFRDLDRPFLNIRFQTKHSSKYRLVMYMLSKRKICFHEKRTPISRGSSVLLFFI